MKKILFAACFFSSGSLLAQSNITQAIINTTTTIVAPDESEDVSNVQIQGGDGARMSFRNFGDGETKSVVYVKNDMVKTVIKSDMGRSTIIRDNAAKKTTTLLEIMGNKTGFYATDEEAAAMRHRMDSMMQATRNAADSNRRMARPSSGETPVEIVYTGDTKKIAGYTCKKAYLVSTHLLGVKDSILVWYSPEIKLNNVSNTGGTFSFGNMMSNGNNPLTALSKINGFPMSYQTKMGRGRIMTVEVTKIDLKKEIADKEFEIPKDFDVKPMSEMRNMMPGGRPGGPGGQRVMIMGN